MERKPLIVVIASALMILAFIGLPVISVSTFGFSATMLDMLFKNSSIMFTLLLLLMLLAPIYLILDVYRGRLSFMEKVKIPTKIASLIPVVCFFFLQLYCLRAQAEELNLTRILVTTSICWQLLRLQFCLLLNIRHWRNNKTNNKNILKIISL